ncbi:MAG TPA: hypothetical protein VNA69_10170 [Thermoanaerobaculia bacterium]|nr:hypothetical protein [Thermoanaerobaculia bacterium]
MDKDLVLLTLGSGRQSREFCRVAERLEYEVEHQHVREDVQDWEVRETDEILADAVEALALLSRQPDAVINFGRASVPDGIRRIAVSMELLRADGRLAAGTKLIGPSARAAQVWGDKALIAESLRSLDLPIPATVDVDLGSVAELARRLERGEFPAPVVVKVVDLTGGSGMRYAADAEQLVKAVEELSQPGRRLVATEFVTGDEVSVDLLRLGTRTLLYPPGFKRVTDTDLTHADHKIKVNGLVREVPVFSRDMLRIAEAFDLQGFFSLEAVITSTDPIRWHILEGATRVTNNIQMQDASLGFDSFAAVLRYIKGEDWLDGPERLGLALSIPMYRHHGLESVQALSGLDWVRQVKLEDLAQMPDSKDVRLRLTAKMAVHDLGAQLAVIVAATGDTDLPHRVRVEIERVRATYVR